MPNDGQFPADPSDLENRELLERTYKLARSRAEGELANNEALGALTREVSFNTLTLRQFLPGLIAAVTPVTGDAPRTPSRDSLRAVRSQAPPDVERLEKAIALKSADITAVTDLKKELAPYLEQVKIQTAEREAEKAVAAADARRTKIISATIVIIGGALGIWQAIAHIH